MTTFFINIFHQKAKNPRKLPIHPKFDVPKVPEVYGPCSDQIFFCADPPLRRDLIYEKW